MVGIYKITNPNGKVYIGQSWDILFRFKTYRKRSSKHTVKLHNSLMAHGMASHSFEIIHELPADVDQAIMDTYEILYISNYKALGIEMLNIREGGRGGKMSEESRRKMSLSRTGRKHKPETIEKLKGRKLSAEASKKLSDAQRGKKRAPHIGALVGAANKTRVWSDESRKKISDAMKAARKKVKS